MPKQLKKEAIELYWVSFCLYSKKFKKRIHPIINKYSWLPFHENGTEDIRILMLLSIRSEFTATLPITANNCFKMLPIKQEVSL